jgi:transposase
MNFIGIDLHKQSISVCVMNQERRVVARKRLPCAAEPQILAFFQAHAPFQAVVEATASYEWLVQLIEPHTDRVILAHPQKLRVIAESVKKTDRLDAQVLAEFLAMDLIPQSHRPCPRLRAHRRLVRHREFLKGHQQSVRCRIRAILSDYNADRKDLFTIGGLLSIKEMPLDPEDRFVVDSLITEWWSLRDQLHQINQRLREFAAQAPPAEAEARAVLSTIPKVGPVTIDVIVSELGDVRRFSSAKQVAAYAGLAPICRESDGKAKQLGIAKRGSGRLRWALVEAAWRLVWCTKRWQVIFEELRKRRGSRKAIVAIARRLLGVITAMLKTGCSYRMAA